MSSRLAAVALLSCALPAAAADDAAAAGAVTAAPERPIAPDWSVTFGAGAIAMPSYPGAASSRVLPVPLIDIRYRNLFFLSPFDGLGVNAIATQRLQVGIAVLPDFGRSASAADRLRNWGDVGAGANVKAFARYALGLWALTADVRRQLGAGNGTLVDAGVTRMLPIGRHLILLPTATLTWADSRYSRAYFGIDQNQSTVALAQGWSLPAYSAGAGFRDAALSLVAIVPVGERWSLQSLLRAEMLLGDAASSPLTEQRIQPTFGAFVAYRL